MATATTSTDSGNYNLVVYPGVYRVSAEAGGFKRFLRTGVTVTASATVRTDATLEIGAVSESVEALRSGAGAAVLSRGFESQLQSHRLGDGD